MPHLAAGLPQTLESLRAHDLMDEVAIDIEQGGAVLRLMHQVIVPDLVVQRPRFGHEAQILHHERCGVI